MKEQLDKNHVPGEKICFEIEELAAVSNQSVVSEFITSLTALGCLFALDNIGLNAFSYLANLPVDYLKIDGSLIKNAESDPTSYAIVKSICDIGHVIGLQVIAKSVENERVKESIADLEIDYCQGYGIGRPLEFNKLVMPCLPDNVVALR